MVLFYILLTTFSVSLISFVGLVLLSFRIDFNKAMSYLLSLAVGGLLGGAFLDLLPEAATTLQRDVFLLTLLGILLFFVLEKLIYAHSCHEGHCEEHPFTSLVLLGDTVHNFIDGLMMAGSFLVSPALGLVTFISVSLHEIPHEIGDFSLLIKGGFTVRKALFYNFLSALAAVLGGISGYFALSLFVARVPYLLPITAGGFIYLALVDIVPQLHEAPKLKGMAVQFLLILLGIFLLAVLPK